MSREAIYSSTRKEWRDATTWSEPGLSKDSIHGTLLELKHLAQLVAEKLSDPPVGSRICIREEFAPGSPYCLVLDVREEGFDPATADPMLQKP